MAATAAACRMSIDTPIVTDTPAVTDTAAWCCDDRDKHGAMLMATDPSSILTPGAAATTASVRTKRCQHGSPGAGGR